jgi:hypothetical protein
MNYRPTHVSRHDGSPAMVSQHDTESPLCIVTNEDGVSWADFVNDWEPMPEAVVGERIVSEYEAERWRAMSDELLGQATRMRHLAGAHGTRADWQAIECIDRAQANLFGAFGAIMLERSKEASDG